MEGDRRHARPPRRGGRRRRRRAVARSQTRAQLHGHRPPPSPSTAAAATATARSGSRDQLGAGAGLADLLDRAAHVQVDQVGPGLGDDGGRPAHHPGIGAEELDRRRVLVGMDPQQLVQRPLVAVVDRVAGDHLRDREPGTVAARLQAYEPVADPGERRQQHPVGDLDVADPNGSVSGLCALTGSAPRSGAGPRSVR